MNVLRSFFMLEYSRVSYCCRIFAHYRITPFANLHNYGTDYTDGKVNTLGHTIVLL